MYDVQGVMVVPAIVLAQADLLKDATLPDSSSLERIRCHPLPGSLRIKSGRLAIFLDRSSCLVAPP